MTDKSAMMEKLDARHLLLDGSAAPGTAWCFRSLQELFASGALQSGTPEAPMTVYLAPDVYWLHDPEDEEIFRGTEGEFLPYQQKIKCNYLSLIGLSEHTGGCGDRGEQGTVSRLYRQLYYAAL